VQPLGIVDLIDKLVDIAPCLFGGAVLGQVDFFFLQGLKEAFDDGVVIRVALEAHADLNAVLLEHVRVLMTGILDIPIAVMKETGRKLTIRQCLL
jgi:hypothetical protein